MPTDAEKRTETAAFRLSRRESGLIDAAVALRDEFKSDLMRRAAVAEAERVLAAHATGATDA